MSKILDMFKKAGDVANPFDNIGASAAKGAAVEAARAIDAFFEKYGLLGAVAKAQPITVTFRVQITPEIGSSK